MSKQKPIGLSEFIFQVKKELLDKQFTERDPVPLLAIEAVEIEMAVVASREGGGGTGLDLSVIGFGGANIGLEGKLSKENAQTVRVTLSPLLNKEQLLARMTPEQRERVMEQAEQAIARGDEGGSTPDTA